MNFKKEYDCLSGNYKESKSIFYKLIYKINYPIWYILTQTLAGNAILIMFTLMGFGVILSLLLPQMINGSSVEQNESIGVGMGMLSLMLSPIIAYPLIRWNDKSKAYYIKNGLFEEKY